MQESVSFFFAGEILKITFYLTSLTLYPNRQDKIPGKKMHFLRHLQSGAHILYTNKTFSFLWTSNGFDDLPSLHLL